MTKSGKAIKDYLKTEFKALLDDPSLHEWIDAHVERAAQPDSYSIMDNIKKFVN